MERNLTDKIVEVICNNIENGKWQRGRFIPPMRTIAESENVSRGIVTAAVSVLVGKGILESVPRHGIRVSESCTLSESDGQMLQRLAKQCAQIMNKRSRQNKARPEDLETIRDNFSGFMDAEIVSARKSESSLISQDEVLLYDKGLRCAGWSPERYTLFKCNLSRNENDLIRGNLLNFRFDASDITFDDKTMDYVEKRVHPNDANDYLSIMNKHLLIEKASEADFFSSIEYREKFAEDYRWVKLSISASYEAVNCLTSRCKMTTLTDLLRKNNCSVDAAIKRMRVKQELYESFVRDFRDDSSFSSYEYALKIEDYDVAYREAHTLKGLTASLGFDDLHTTVCKITRAILNHDYKQVIFLNDELISRYELITGLIGFIE